MIWIKRNLNPIQSYYTTIYYSSTTVSYDLFSRGLLLYYILPENIIYLAPPNDKTQARITHSKQKNISIPFQHYFVSPSLSCPLLLVNYLQWEIYPSFPRFLACQQSSSYPNHPTPLRLSLQNQQQDIMPLLIPATSTY